MHEWRLFCLPFQPCYVFQGYHLRILQKITRFYTRLLSPRDTQSPVPLSSAFNLCWASDGRCRARVRQGGLRRGLARGLRLLPYAYDKLPSGFSPLRLKARFRRHGSRLILARQAQASRAGETLFHGVRARQPRALNASALNYFRRRLVEALIAGPRSVDWAQLLREFMPSRAPKI